MAVLNPNNWHWVDKNTLPWTKQYFNDKFVNYELTQDDSKITIVAINKINGDSNVSQRKGKPICYFDLDIEFKLVVSTDNESESESDNDEGFVNIPEFMHDETEPFITIKGFNQQNSTLIKSKFIPAFKSILLNYQADLLNEHSKDLQD
ncbi:hsp90 co-chaperone Hch1p [Monosporozyma servazzii]